MSGQSIMRRFRVHQRLFFTVLMLITLSLSLCGGAIYVLTRQSLQESIDQELGNTTKTIVNMVLAAVDVSVRNYLRAVAEKNLELVQFFYRQYQEGLISEAEAKAKAEQVLLSQTIGRTGYIYCIDSQGGVALHPLSGVQGTNQWTHAFVREQVRLKTGYIEYDWANPGEAEERPKAMYMTYFEPWDWIISATTYREEFKTLVNAEDFREEVAAIRLGDSGYIFILDGDGKVVMHPWVTGNICDFQKLLGSEFIDEVLRRGKGRITYDWKGQSSDEVREKIAVFEKLPEVGWIVAASMYADEVNKPVSRVVYTVFIAIMLAVLGAVPVIILLGHSVIRPVDRLVGLFGKAAAGDLETRSDDFAPDEIGMLARRFNAFMTQLEETNRDLLAQMQRRENADAAREELLQKLEASNLEMERFIYTVSHDLRSPLITVLGFVGVLIKECEDKNPEGVRHAAGRIENAARHMQGLLDELLQLSRIGRVGSPLEKVSLDKLVQDVLELLQGSLSICDITINVLPLGEVLGDRKRLLEVYQNLVENSIKYSQGSGPAVITIGREQRDSRTVYFVRDNGQGVQPRYLDKIFNLFEQLDQKFEGTGVGLALIKRIIEVHGGEIWAESEGVGMGMTICFTLPEADDADGGNNENGGNIENGGNDADTPTSTS